RRQATFILGSTVEISKTVKDAVAFKIAVRLYIVVASEIFAVGFAEYFDHFLVGPDVEFAFLTFRVGVKRGEKRAPIGSHFAAEPRNDFARSLCKQLIAAVLPSQ